MRLFIYIKNFLFYKKSFRINFLTYFQKYLLIKNLSKYKKIKIFYFKSKFKL